MAAPELPDFLTPPVEGTELAGRVDELLGFTLLYSAFFSVLIASLLFYLGYRYRRRSAGEVGRLGGTAPKSLEIVWSAVPLAIVLFTFYWGAEVYFQIARPPADADEYFVVARQWMWKVQHPDGPKEINTLHVPVGRAIKLTMTSEDVIHSFYVPAFRVKSDVLPGRYTTLWFRASRPGTHHLFCAEYCGTEHSRMIGSIVVMEPFEYESWLAGGRWEQGPPASGEEIFRSHGCPTCHRPDTAARAPILNGLFGATVVMQDGSTVTVDEGYLRESILRPAAKVVKGYQPVMPAYQGQLSEEEVMLLITYIRSLQGEGGVAR